MASPLGLLDEGLGGRILGGMAGAALASSNLGGLGGTATAWTPLGWKGGTGGGGSAQIEHVMTAMCTYVC